MDFAELAFERIEGIKLKDNSFYDKKNIHTSSSFNLKETLNSTVHDSNVVFLFSVSSSEDEVLANNLIRKELYLMEDIKAKFLFIDLGNLNISIDKAETAFKYIFSEIEENINCNFKFIILSQSRKMLPALVAGITENEIVVTDINLAFDNEQEFLNLHRHDKVRFYNLLSALQFYYNKEIRNDTYFLNLLRLGEIKNDIYLVEPYIRESAVVIHSANSVSSAFAPGAEINSPNGLDAYNFSILSYLSAISNVKYNIYTAFLNYQNDKTNITGKLFAQSIWIFLNSFTNAIIETPTFDIEQFEKLIHFYPEIDLEIVFLKSKKTKRYWVNIPNSNYFVAISDKEYVNITKGDMPERILKILRKL